MVKAPPFARGAAWLAAPLLFAAMLALNARGGPTYAMGDFRAFYCAGAAVAAGADPYREQPLHACELGAQPPRMPVALRGITLPAPLPPHALLAFSLFARLPFLPAALLYGALLLGAMTASTVLFARFAGTSSVAVNLTFAAITASVTYYVGQPVPFVMLALGAAALFARGGRWTAAAVCASAATIEPHLALPALAGLAVACPRARVPLAACGAALAALAACACGPAVLAEYLREVVPAHALANAYEWQFSLTSVLTSLGAGAHAAVRAGEVMFAAMTALGVAAALRLRRITGDAAVVVLVPPAFAVFGGVHVHFQQLAVAFPAVLYVAVRRPRVRALATAGLVLAMIPWNVMSASLLAGASPLLAGAFAALMLGRRAGIACALGAAAIGLSLLALAGAGLGPATIAFEPHAYPPNALAEASWADFSRAVLMRPSPLMHWLRIPTLVGLACALAAVASAAWSADAARTARRAAPAPLAAASAT